MSEFDVGHEPRNAIKAKSLSDFIQKITTNKTTEQKWLIYVDGSSAVGGSGGGIILLTSEGDQLEYAAKFEFRASNNEAEYEALVRGMELAIRLGVRQHIAYSDSQLVSQQVGVTLEVREERRKRYVQEVKNLSSQIG